MDFKTASQGSEIWGDSSADAVEKCSKNFLNK